PPGRAAAAAAVSGQASAAYARPARCSSRRPPARPAPRDRRASFVRLVLRGRVRAARRRRVDHGVDAGADGGADTVGDVAGLIENLIGRRPLLLLGLLLLRGGGRRRGALLRRGRRRLLRGRGGLVRGLRDARRQGRAGGGRRILQHVLAGDQAD